MFFGSTLRPTFERSTSCVRPAEFVDFPPDQMSKKWGSKNNNSNFVSLWKVSKSLPTKLGKGAPSKFAMPTSIFLLFGHEKMVLVKCRVSDCSWPSSLPPAFFFLCWRFLWVWAEISLKLYFSKSADQFARSVGRICFSRWLKILVETFVALIRVIIHPELW